MSVNFSLLFYLKKQKNYRMGPDPVYLRITVAGQRAEMATGRECCPPWPPEGRRGCLVLQVTLP